MKNKTTFCVIGCGRLGSSLAVFLAKGGFVPVAFASRSQQSAQRVFRFVNAGKVYQNPVDAVRAAEVVFITTPDALIQPVCEAIADEGGFNENHFVYHMSGALSSEILQSAKKKCGANTGSIHPLQAFAPYEVGQQSQFDGINISVEGDEAAVALGKKIIGLLAAQPITIPTDCKTAYHASAVVASNYLVTVLHFAVELLKQAGLTEEDSYRILEPLISGTLDNIKTKGSIKALTGPIARGDYTIVSEHLREIDKRSPYFSELYKVLGRYTLDLAKQSDGIDAQAQEKLENLLKS